MDDSVAAGAAVGTRSGWDMSPPRTESAARSRWPDCTASSLRRPSRRWAAGASALRIPSGHSQRPLPRYPLPGYRFLHIRKNLIKMRKIE